VDRDDHIAAGLGNPVRVQEFGVQRRCARWTGDSGSKTAGSRSYSTLIRRQASSAIVALVATTAVTDLRENPGRAQYFWLEVG
jgi:hypothetical protein